ncbi:MAG TPA: aspartyl/asparaginyl beta-hydroxylase domain-containing protein [Candidatus Sulfotelmatobacter sp.]|nr:aspartyl/asparaginyl beta-hydroxylase domain-containing protein [Candidatus Sulfotelmatobacter sp.]
METVASLAAKYAIVADELRRRDAHLMPHGMASLFVHLTQTFGILEAWDCRDDLCIAGLLHSVYSTDTFASSLIPLSDRDLVRLCAGEEAERLAYLFCALDRRSLTTAATRAPDGEDVLTLYDRFENRLIRVPASDASDLLVLHIANLAEQQQAKNKGPTAWLHRAAALGRAARKLGARLPPILVSCTEHVTAENEESLLEAYSALLSTTFHDEAARQGLIGATLGPSIVAEPLIWLGLHALAANSFDEAARHGRASVEALCSWNTAWDKRLSPTQWLALANLLATLPQLDDKALSFLATQVHRSLNEHAAQPFTIFAALDRVGAVPKVTAAEVLAVKPSKPLDEFVESGSIPPRFATYIAQLRDADPARSMRFYPDLRSQAWWDASGFSVAKDLERAAPEICRELTALASEHFHSETERISRTGAWNVMLLLERGRIHEERCALVPTTMEVLSSSAVIRTHAGLAYFSRMAPGTAIAPHRGPTNMRLRCHLGISVPLDCGIRVDGITRRWERGKTLVFDDSFVHEAWNSSHEERIVLIVDLWHPDLSKDEITLLGGLQGYTAEVGVNLSRYWANNDRAERMRQLDL